MFIDVANPDDGGAVESVCCNFNKQGEKRRVRAKYILEMPIDDMEINLKKFLRLFKTDLAFSAATGYCSYRVFIALRGAASMIHPDAQESERLNKMLTLFGDRCPSGTLDLCTGRAVLKHFLGLNGYHGSTGTRKFSEIKPTATLLLRECMAGWPLIHEVDANEQRFKPAEGRADVPTLAQANKALPTIEPQASTKASPARLWSASLNARVGKRLSELKIASGHGLVALSFVMPPMLPGEAPLIFLVTDKVRSTIHLVGCRRQEAACGQRSRYLPQQPWTFARSHDVFQRFYRLLAGNANAQIVISQLLLHTLEDSLQIISGGVVFVVLVPVYLSYCNNGLFGSGLMERSGSVEYFNFGILWTFGHSPCPMTV